MSVLHPFPEWSSLLLHWFGGQREQPPVPQPLNQIKIKWSVRGLQQLSVGSVVLGEEGSQCVQKNETNILHQKRQWENAHYYGYIWTLGTPWNCNLCVQWVFTFTLKLKFLATCFEQEFKKYWSKLHKISKKVEVEISYTLHLKLLRSETEFLFLFFWLIFLPCD